jgi:hypothetical protein
MNETARIDVLSRIVHRFRRVLFLIGTVSIGILSSLMMNM